MIAGFEVLMGLFSLVVMGVVLGCLCLLQEHWWDCFVLWVAKDEFVDCKKKKPTSMNFKVV